MTPRDVTPPSLAQNVLYLNTPSGMPFVQSYNQGATALAKEILDWLNERPMTSLETLVIELRIGLEQVLCDARTSKPPV